MFSYISINKRMKNIIFIISIIHFLLANSYAQEMQDDEMILRRRTESMISKSKFDCIKTFDSLIIIYEGKLGMISDFGVQIFTQTCIEKRFLKKTKFPCAQIYIVNGRTVLGLSDGRYLYSYCQNITGNNDAPNEDPFINFIYEHDLVRLFTIGEVRGGLYYGISRSGTKLFFEKIDKGVRILSIKDIYATHN